jgi:hypothetical protein
MLLRPIITPIPCLSKTPLLTLFHSWHACSCCETILGRSPRLSPCAHCPGLFSFAGVVLEQFLDEVDVGEDHAATAVALETDGIKGVAEGERVSGADLM